MPYYPNTWVKYSAYIGNLGLYRFLKYWVKRRTHRRLRTDFQLCTPLARFPLHCRPRSSDVDVFKQIFAQHEYSCVAGLPVDGPGLIVDCGANAGFSTAYLLTRFPEATVLAVEPDPENYQALLRNTAPYGDRVRCVEAAMWSHSTAKLSISTSSGDGREWARTVQDSTSGASGGVAALTIGQLLAKSGHERIRLLKVDIEGAEKEVFGETSRAWLTQVDCIVIELHGKECEAIFARSVASHGFVLRRHMELTIAERVKG